MKKLLLRASYCLLGACMIAGASSCSDDDNNNPPKTITITSGSTSQSIYADQTSVNGNEGIQFKATEPWTASVKEVATKAAAERVDWLELNAYSGGPGNFTLKMTLTPNTTGNTRKAEITIVAGPTKITIIVEQKGTTQSGEIPSTQKLIKKILMSFYDEGQEEGTVPIELSYDDQNRVVKIVSTDEVDVDEEGAAQSKTNIEVTTVTFTYGNKTVAYEVSKVTDGTLSEYKDSGSIVLDDKGRAVSGRYIFYEDKGEKYKLEGSYTLTYNAQGYLTKSVDTNNSDVTTSDLTWSNGNLTSVKWGERALGETVTDRAEYGTTLNKANLDLNWMAVLETEGSDFATGDHQKIFAALGYLGTRSTNLAVLVTDGAQDKSTARSRYSFSVDGEGYPTVITEDSYNGYTESWSRSSVCTITYNK